MSQLEADKTTVKERVSWDKIRSFGALVYGQRARHFDAFLKTVPTSIEMTALAKQLGKPEIESTIFDLDGNLVAPYAPIPPEVIELLLGYKKDGRNIGIQTNSPHTDRLDILRDNGIAIAETGLGKPTLEAARRFCEQQKMDPAHTAMSGNFPITDMPLVKECEPPFFPLNVLAESIPPQRELVETWGKYMRARLFHALNVATAGIVLIRNPNIVREII